MSLESFSGMCLWSVSVGCVSGVSLGCVSGEFLWDVSLKCFSGVSLGRVSPGSVCDSRESFSGVCLCRDFLGNIRGMTSGEFLRGVSLEGFYKVLLCVTGGIF